MSGTGTTTRAWATGGLVFAATMLIIVGFWQAMVGLAAMLADDFFVATPNYAFRVDTTLWGWVHLSFGVLCIVTGCALFTGALWARVVGIVLAGLSAIGNFVFLPHYPLWALAVIAIDVFVIWSLATVGATVRLGQPDRTPADAFTTTPEQAAEAARADVADAQARAGRARTEQSHLHR